MHDAALRLPPDDGGRSAADPALARACRMSWNGGAIRTSSIELVSGDLDEPAMEQFIVSTDGSRFRLHPVL